MVVSKTTGGGSIPSGSAILDYGVMVSTSDFESGSSGSSPDSPASCQVGPIPTLDSQNGPMM